MARKRPGSSLEARRDGGPVKVTVSLDGRLAARLRAFAAFKGVDLGAVVAEGLGPVLRGFVCRLPGAGEPTTIPEDVGDQAEGIAGRIAG